MLVQERDDLLPRLLFSSATAGRPLPHLSRLRTRSGSKPRSRKQQRQTAEATTRLKSSPTPSTARRDLHPGTRPIASLARVRNRSWRTRDGAGRRRASTPSAPHCCSGYAERVFDSSTSFISFLLPPTLTSRIHDCTNRANPVVKDLDSSHLAGPANDHSRLVTGQPRVAGRRPRSTAPRHPFRSSASGLRTRRPAAVRDVPHGLRQTARAEQSDRTVSMLGRRRAKNLRARV